MAQANNPGDLPLDRDSGVFESTEDSRGPVQETDDISSAVSVAGALGKSANVPIKEKGAVGCTSLPIQETTEGQELFLEDSGGKKTLWPIQMPSNANNSHGGVHYYQDPSSEKVYEVKEFKGSVEGITSVHKEQRSMPNGQKQSESTVRVVKCFTTFMEDLTNGRCGLDTLKQLYVSVHQAVAANHEVGEAERQQESLKSKECLNLTAAVNEHICQLVQPENIGETDPDPVAASQVAYFSIIPKIPRDKV